MPSIKQHLAAVRMLFDWLVVGQVLPANPAAAVRGPKHRVTRGKTPVLSPDQARQLLDCLPTDTVIGLRDRALIGVLIYSFARVSAALTMAVADYYPQGRRMWLLTCSPSAPSVDMRVRRRETNDAEEPVHRGPDYRRAA